MLLPRLLSLLLVLLFLSCKSISNKIIKSTPPIKEQYLLESVVPQGYMLSLWLDPKEEIFFGHVTININLKESRKDLFINVSGLHVYSALIKNKKEEYGARFYPPTKGHELARVAFTNELRKGKYQLELIYQGKYNRAGYGLYKHEHDNKNYLFTDLSYSKARVLFPCFDDPNVRTPFWLKVSAPKDLHVQASSPLLFKHSKGDEETYFFEKTASIPARQLSLSVGLFQVKHKKITSNYYRDEAIKFTGLTIGKKFSWPTKKIANIISSLENYFISSYPFSALNIISAPNKKTLSTVSNIILDQSLLAMEREKDFYLEVSCALAAQWFGNLLSASKHNELWFNRSIATFYGYKVVGTFISELNILDILAKDRTFMKGEKILFMLEEHIGEKNFARAISYYLNSFSYSSVTIEDFLHSLAKYSDHKVMEAARLLLNNPLSSIYELAHVNPLIAYMYFGYVKNVFKHRYKNKQVMYEEIKNLYIFYRGKNISMLENLLDDMKNFISNFADL